MRASYKTAVESGEDDDKLDAMDKELYQLGRQHTRVEIRLNQCNIEIENLFHAREAAHAEEDRAKYDEDAQLAVSEAKEIEQAVQGPIASASQPIRGDWAGCENIARRQASRRSLSNLKTLSAASPRFSTGVSRSNKITKNPMRDFAGKHRSH